jgi:nicotinate-nucleotide adenylyltransferase
LRLGVFGGSFNPPHVGHYLIASDAFEALELDKLLIVPAAANPLKGLDPAASAGDRLKMVELAFEGDSRFEVSSMEIQRGGLSYTVDTLEALAEQHPGAELVLLIGMDALRTIDRWKQPHRIRELATLAVLSRGEDGVPLPDGIEAVTTRRIDVSSTEIRARIAEGRSIKGFVAASVEKFISTAKLYAGNVNA